MFNFERAFSRQDSIPAATQGIRQTLEERQRDIFESHRHRAFALAFYMTGNELEAEEILANTFIRAFQQEEQPDALGVDSALLVELSDRFALDQEPLEAADAAASHDRSLGGCNIRRSDLEIAIGELPPRERLLFLLRDVEGYSLEMIGTLTSIPQPEAERSLFSARLRLRRILAARSQSTSEAA